VRPVFGKIENTDHAFVMIKQLSTPRQEFLWHYHHVNELNLVVKGRGTRFIGDHITHYEEGDLVLMGPGLPHTWCSDPGLPKRRGVYHAVTIQFAEQFLGESLVSDPEWHDVRVLLKRAAQGVSFTGEVRDAASRRIRKLAALSGPSKLACFIDVLDLLAQSRQYATLSSPDYVPALPSEHETRIDHVCTYINQHYTDAITQPEAAAVANMSVYAFSRFFKKMMGRSFTDYVTALRIGHSCKLLIETDQSVTEVAYGSGFNNLSNFNRRFLERKSVPPTVYRETFSRSQA
jgi:AraC-like DNA-binding protein